MIKELQREIMKRSRLRNNSLRTKSQEDRLKYNKQQDFCKKLLRTAKKLCFNNLDIKEVVDNRSFWKTVSPLFSTKCSKGDKIILNENDKYVSNHVKFFVTTSPILSLNFKFQVYPKIFQTRLM